ncbi:MAG: rhodanese-like domain-containing protein, partial [Cyclobacteriaceae bacterium]
MKKISYLLLIPIILSCSTKDGNKETQVEDNSIISETITSEEFQKKISVADHPVILDVRTRGEVAQGYISGATNIDFRGDDFEERLNALDKEATYFVYCGSGGRSRQTADRM